MNEEVEIKVILKNSDDVISFLNEKAKFVKEKNQKDEYFVPIHKDFFSVNPTKEYLRVRYEEEKNHFGYHFCHFEDDGSLLKTDEYETKVENPEIISEILKKLDMIHKVTITKHRKFYDYKNFEILIDYIEELGYFLEIEAKKIDGSIKNTKEQCYKILEELGAEWEKAPNMGYPDMLLEKQNRN